MSTLVAIPIMRVRCRIGIDRGRSWSVVEEAILWSALRTPRTIEQITSSANLPKQVVVSAISRLMQFRLIEVVDTEGTIAFQASEYGLDVSASGRNLPSFPKRIEKWVHFVIEQATGELFLERAIRYERRRALVEKRSNGDDVREIEIESGQPSASSEANLQRIAEMFVPRLDEQVATIDSRTAVITTDEFMMVRVREGVPVNLPENSGSELKKIVQTAAARPSGTKRVKIEYAGHTDRIHADFTYHQCTFDPADIIVGGSAQKACLESLLAGAHRRVIIHSTFLSADRFNELFEIFERTCARGVVIDLLWGAEQDAFTENANLDAARAIASRVRGNRAFDGHFRVGLRTTGSHSKLILTDSPDGQWLANVGSCNWLYSPFMATELTITLRDPHAVADVASALSRLAGDRGLADRLSSEMAITARDLRSVPKGDGKDLIAVVCGEAHDRLMRQASDDARSRFVVASNKFGATARTGAILPGQRAAEGGNVRATLLYHHASGPTKNSMARDISKEAEANGVRVVRVPRKLPIHGKFLTWDDDDIVVTSLNWASASSDPDAPLGEIGVHVRSAKIAQTILAQLETLYPQLAEPD